MDFSTFFPELYTSTLKKPAKIWTRVHPTIIYKTVFLRVKNPFSYKSEVLSDLISRSKTLLLTLKTGFLGPKTPKTRKPSFGVKSDPFWVQKPPKTCFWPLKTSFLSLFGVQKGQNVPFHRKCHFPYGLGVFSGVSPYNTPSQRENSSKKSKIDLFEAQKQCFWSKKYTS